MDDLLLGIDIGTSSSKGVIVRTDGSIVARAERAHQLSLPKPGWAEHDAEGVWWEDAVQICQELTAATGRISGVCVSGIGPCVVPVDERNRPLRPAILYGIDTRATREIADLNDELGDDRILERCGSALTSQAIGPKLLWLRRQEPQTWAKTNRFYMASSFVVQRLTGAYILDHHSASQCDPLYDLHAGTWALDWADLVAPGLELPRLAWPTDIVGHVTQHAAAMTGIPMGTPVVAGTIDAWAEALSVDVRDVGDTMLMYGTTMFVLHNVIDFQANRTMWGTTGLFPGSRCLAGGMATSGALTSWLRRLTGNPAFEELDCEAGRIEPGANGLVVLPYFEGERTPIFDPDARGVVAGLTLRHDRGHLHRALLESTGYAVRHILEALEAAGGRPRRLVAVGGGTQSRLWTQIVSDIGGHAQEVPAVTVGASYGDGLLAAIGCGAVDPGTRWNQDVTVVRPQTANRRRYDSLYEVYRALYPATSGPIHVLAAIQHGEPAPSSMADRQP